jgi:hypothetical protein
MEQSPAQVVQLLIVELAATPGCKQTRCFAGAKTLSPHRADRVGGLRTAVVSDRLGLRSSGQAGHRVRLYVTAQARTATTLVPDGGLCRTGPDELYNATAALVIEVVSPGDETWDKLPFYAAHRVDEVLIVDPQKRAVEWLALENGEYRSVPRSRLIELGPEELANRIAWPAPD